MSDGYTPRDGSVPALVTEFLAAHPHKKLNKDEIAAKHGCVPASVSVLMKKSVEAGLVLVEKVGNGYVYSAPSGASAASDESPEDGKLAIASHSDGDVTVKGHTENVDGSITFTRQHMVQLIEHVTTPHLALHARRTCSCGPTCGTPFEWPTQTPAKPGQIQRNDA